MWQAGVPALPSGYTWTMTADFMSTYRPTWIDGCHHVWNRTWAEPGQLLQLTSPIPTTPVPFHQCSGYCPLQLEVIAQGSEGHSLQQGLSHHSDRCALSVTKIQETNHHAVNYPHLSDSQSYSQKGVLLVKTMSGWRGISVQPAHSVLSQTLHVHCVEQESFLQTPQYVVSSMLMRSNSSISNI